MTEETFSPAPEPAAPVDPAMAAPAPPLAPDPAATVLPPDPAVTMPPPPPAEPAVDPTVTAAAPAEPVVDEPVVDEAVQTPPVEAEPADEAAEPPPADGDGDGVAGEYGDGPDGDGNGIPDEIGINPDSMRGVEDAAEPVAEDPMDVGDDFLAEEQLQAEPPDLSDRIDLDSTAVDDLSARQFLEVQELLKDTSSLSDSEALADLDPSQMQLLIGALADQVNDPSGDSEGGGFGVQDLLDPDAPGPTLDPGLIDNLDADQMGQVQEVLGGEGPPDLAALEELSPDQVQAVVQSFLGYLGTPGASVVDDSDTAAGAVSEAEVDETQDLDDAVTNLEDAIIGGDEGEVSDAIDDLREFIRDAAGGEDGAEADLLTDYATDPVDSESAEGPIGTSRSALTADSEGGAAENDSDVLDDVGTFFEDAGLGAYVIGDAVVGAAGDVGESFIGIFEDPIGAVEDVGEAFGSVAEDTGELFEDAGLGAVVIGEAVGEAFIDVGESFIGIFEDPIGAVEDVGEAFGSVAEDTGQVFEHAGLGAVVIGEEVIGAVGDVGEAVGDVAEDVGDFFGDLF